jgi:L-ascorbate metabolism protein UlaG (beta-lactamase superfamily)
MDIIAGGLKVTALHCLHETETADNSEAENLAYLIEMDGWNILHVGDIEARRTSRDALSSFSPLIEKGIDLLFLPAGFLDNPKGADIIRNFFRPGRVVLMHHEPSMSASLKKAAERIQEGLPPLEVFEKENQSRVFQIRRR